MRHEAVQIEQDEQALVQFADATDIFGADAGHRDVTEFYTSEHAFYSASFARIGWSAGYSYSFRKSSLCLDFEGDHIMTDDSRSRTFLGACLSYVF